MSLFSSLKRLFSAKPQTLESIIQPITINQIVEDLEFYSMRKSVEAFNAKAESDRLAEEARRHFDEESRALALSSRYRDLIVS